MSKRAAILGGGGFIGSHLSARLVAEGYETVLVDLKAPEFRDLLPGETYARGDLRDPYVAWSLAKQGFDEWYQLAALMGGMGFISGDNDADIQHDSCLINLNALDALSKLSPGSRVFYSSSACAYPERNQLDPDNPVCSEDSAYPADPDSEYGWEKLFSERLYASYAKNKGLDVRVTRFHNIFGPMGTFEGGKEKAPAALCRKVAKAKDGDAIEIWGDGKQTRSFLYIDECVEGVRRLMRSSVTRPLNIGSDEMVTIDQLARAIIDLSGKNLTIQHVPGPQGVRGRCSDNRMIERELGWRPTAKLIDGLRPTYAWIERMVAR